MNSSTEGNGLPSEGPIGLEAAADELLAEASASSGSESEESSSETGGSSAGVEGWERDLRSILTMAKAYLEPRAPRWAPSDAEIDVLAPGLAPCADKYLGEFESIEGIALMAVASYLVPRLFGADGTQENRSQEPREVELEEERGPFAA